MTYERTVSPQKYVNRTVRVFVVALNTLVRRRANRMVTADDCSYLS
jgi:hypothetical protein